MGWDIRINGWCNRHVRISRINLKSFEIHPPEAIAFNIPVSPPLEQGIGSSRYVCTQRADFV